MVTSNYRLITRPGMYSQRRLDPIGSHNITLTLTFPTLPTRGLSAQNLGGSAWSMVTRSRQAKPAEKMMQAFFLPAPGAMREMGWLR